jgi:CubicO group peptidase (beta-lactamase class C family)
LYLRGGVWNGQRILPADFVAEAGTAAKSIRGLAVRPGDPHPGASSHYGLLWWNNADGTLANVPRDAFWSWGLGDSLIVVIPSQDLVAARAGKIWKREPTGGHYDVLKPFLGPIAAAAAK